MTVSRDATSSRVVVVAGSGRSGTSSVAGVLKIAGLHIPPPEVPGNRSNPRGFFEPRWAVDFQTRLLRQAGASLTDARPVAAELAEATADGDDVRRELGEWLSEHLATSPRLLVKDPRNSWFLPMWRRAVAEAGAEVSFLTMLRHPAEVVGSKDTYYKSRSSGETVRQAQTTRVAGWLNVVLTSERLTRGSRRSFVLYNDLLADWRGVLSKVAVDLDLGELGDVADDAAAEIDEFVDPGLHRVRTTWDDIECPEEVRAMAEETWEHLVALAGSDGSEAAAEAALDGLWERYCATYRDAEALAQSSVERARREGVQQGRRTERKARAKDRASAAPTGAGADPARAASPVARVRAVAGRVVRRVRG